MALDWRELDRVSTLASGGYGSGDATFSLEAAGNSSYRAFPAAMDGLVLPYFAQDLDGTNDEYEVGTGTYTHVGRTLGRTVLKSSNADARVAFSRAPIVAVDFIGLYLYYLDLFLNITGSGGNVAVARTALGVADSDINTLVDARVAAMQASGQLPPDPALLADGTMSQVQTGAWVVLT